MPASEVRERPPWTAVSSACAHRRVFVVTESLVALSGLMGAVQLVAGVATPPAADLPPGLSSWVLPAGPNPLQAVFGGLAVALGALGWHARRTFSGPFGALRPPPAA